MINIKDCYGKDYTFVDVRSPKEFEIDTIPNAINIPIFSDEERAIIGTIYTKESQQKAIREGIKLASKNLPNILKEFKKLKDKKIIIFCWRGGMRSKAITSLMKSKDYNVEQLGGGYKSYRKFIIQNLESWKPKNKIYVLHGLTGSGKTDIIKQIKNSIDLEGFAQHRGSFYGDIGLKQNSQKKFESLLYQALTKLENKSIIVEGESRKIGKVQIPESFWKAMKQGTNLLIEVPIKTRINIILRDYGNAPKELLKEKTKLLKKHLSKKEIENICNLIDTNLPEAIRLILVKYYDPLYNKNFKDIKSKVKKIEEIKEIIT